MFNLSERIQYYFNNLQNVGELDTDKPNVILAEIKTPDGYTHVQLFIAYKEDIIKQCKFKVLGCPSVIATLAFLSEYLLEKNLLECEKITAEFLIKQLELSPEKYYVAGVVEDLLKKIKLKKSKQK